MGPRPFIKSVAFLLILIAIAVIALAPDSAQPTTAQRRRGPRVTRARANDVSQPLREIKPIPAKPFKAIREMRISID